MSINGVIIRCTGKRKITESMYLSMPCFRIPKRRVSERKICCKSPILPAEKRKISLDEDEMEAVRLSDFEGLYQQECANKMGVSRTTFSRLIQNAHKKIADALLHGKAIVMTKENEFKEE